MQPTRKRLTLNDGTTLSVQAGTFHYCSPREDDAVAYSHLEIGFVEPASAVPDSWAEWVEGGGDDDNWKQDAVFCYVPARVVFDFMLEHGGPANGEIPPLAFFDKPTME